MLPDSFIQQLKFACDIEQIVSPYTRLTRKGKNMVGLCPFHSEKTGSFFIYPDSQSYYCFGCGAGGDVITFVMAAENLDYIEAVKFLAERCGMTLPESDTDYREAKLKTRILEINKETARYYHNCLISDEGKGALSYLYSRGLTPKTIRRFGLGFSPNRWDGVINHLTEKGYFLNELEQAGIAVKSSKLNKNGKHTYYDRFRGRVIFPIIDIRGNVIAFGGRALDNNGAKYLNSADTPVFKKSRNLFALNLAKQTKRDSIIFCEGYMDVISLHQAGFDCAVASLGTALTEEQARLAVKYTNKVVLAYDSDNAGQAATARAIKIFSDVGIKVHVLDIPDAKDPDEYIKKFGSERFEMLLSGSANALEFQIERLRSRYDLQTDDGKVAFLKDFAALMAGIHGSIEREVYISRIADQTGVSKESINLQVERLRKSRDRNQKRKEQLDTAIRIGETPANKQDPQRSRNLRCALAEERLIAALYKNPDYIRVVQGKITPQDFTVDVSRTLYEVITSRIAENKGIDMIHLSGQLSPEQMSRLSGILASIPENPSVEEVRDYVSVILESKQEKTQKELAQMNADELKDYISSLAAKKK
ncbi:MAG: DNA primase [Oscillospiraceae bacterium]|nr:DNA primase [Oscillospiraceae bacterium]